MPPAAGANSSAHASTPEVVVRSTTVRTSFADAAQHLGLDASTVALLTRSYAADLDFRRDLRHGDTISLVLAQPRAGESGDAPPRAPLAVRIQQGAKSHDLFLHRGLDGRPFYYKQSGAAASPSFARYPLAYGRISSRFAHRRLDPITHRWQSHDGVDLAAPAGTPVHATARGTVAFIGRQTGYGRLVVLNNAPPYQTAFAHLSRFAKGLHRGSRVRRGQVIGYVGATGWATGPHLHFEVRVNHVPMDPLTVALPGDPPLRGRERRQFAEQANHLAALL